MSDIYRLIDPRDNTVRYVGKSYAPKFRLSQHRRSHEGNAAKSQWLSELRSLGLSPRLEVIEEGIEDRYQVCRREQYWVQLHLEQGQPLTNIMYKPALERRNAQVGCTVMTQSEQEQWIPLTDAAREIGISAAKLSRMAKNGRVKTLKDPYDERKTLVDLVELRRIFPPRK